ncbi:restriction endonuclease subunit S [Clostridium celatum]|uniref:Type I restriction modification DNA specificity domain protein n=1 Tax=Clostridium celatum DSM 1785 TaxID=545697 RepID=L1QKL1_9CLOT|nr:restriction endonuclease subunit S [Clostridium celatum]EKY28112.1 type I restriction modification DNA specificity domain protein [Clostridium celatum DSM 1785]MCE9654126.1 restriction endonuclease subunit S [Clostridium celatum]
MSRLEELIEAMCPDGVEYKMLKDISIMQRGTAVTKKDLKIGDIPVISGGKDPAYYCDKYNREGETITIAGSGASAGYVQYWNMPIWVCDAFSIKAIDNNYTKYLFYCLTNIQEYIYGTKKGSGVPHVYISSIDKVKIPVPPIAIQEEIVRILDSYTELKTKLISELTSELEARRKQYEYYRDELFGKDCDEMINRCLKNNIKVITLEELGKFTRGKRFVRNDIKEEGVPCIHYGDLYTYFGVSAKKTKCFLDKELSKKMRFAHKGDVVIVQAGENDMDIGIGVAWMGDEDVVVHDACYIFEHNINPKYISYYLRTNIYHLQIKKYVSIGKICSISAQGIGKALIPIPSLEEQQRIVDILEKYDVIYKGISIEIQAEIEAIQKQYDYYRDKLLTFKGKN